MNIPLLKKFISPLQLKVTLEYCKGEEGQFFKDVLNELTERIEKMPKTYETDGQGLNAIVHLHYFKDGMNWWITEKDVDTDGEGQIQAFGLADLFGDGGELGYISIKELLENNVELDYHFPPCPLKAAITFGNN